MITTVVSHFSKTISQTMTFWELGLGFFGIRVIIRGQFAFYGRSKVLEKWETTANNNHNNKDLILNKEYIIHVTRSEQQNKVRRKIKMKWSKVR